jgi:hypothetical protein
VLLQLLANATCFKRAAELNHGGFDSLVFH